MKKIIAMLLCIAMCFGLFCGCGEANQGADNGKLKIVATIFPVYDWVQSILGDKADEVDMTLLLDSGVDLHSYQPTVDDFVTISDCDLFLYVGGESDQWVEDALSNTQNPNRRVISLMDILGSDAKLEETTEGMEAEEDEEEEEAYDEHVWLSLKNAAVFTEAILAELKEILPDDAGTLDANGASYIEKIHALDEQYQAAVDQAEIRTLLFGDRFPFLYLTEDYGLDYYAAFVGCSAETEASFETVTFLAQKVDELGLSTVLAIEGSDHKLAQTIIENTASKDQKLLTVNSIQSVNEEEIQSGTTYLSLMEENLTVLRKALQPSI